MPHKLTIIGVYYADLPHKKLVAVKEKRRGKKFSTDDELKYVTEDWLKEQ